MTPDEPISNVVWRDRNDLKANGYNPNKVFDPELDLLEQSIVKDGWTTAIVLVPEPDADGFYEIVDGFHRWLVSGRPDVAKKTGGLVPTVTLRPSLTEAEQKISTVRHNRARGKHNVLRMSEITQALTEAGYSADDLGEALGMEEDEVVRLLDQGSMTKRGPGESFGKAWAPQ